MPFAAAAAAAFGGVAASLRAEGRKPAPRAYDALLAAVALSQGHDQHPANPDDFTGIDALAVDAVDRH